MQSAATTAVVGNNEMIVTKGGPLLRTASKDSKDREYGECFWEHC